MPHAPVPPVAAAADPTDADPAPSAEDLRAAFGRCDRWIRFHGWQDPAAHLAALPTDIAPDVYGRGGVVEALEGEVAEVLGAEAAVFMPSGTMAQQAALRVHADRRGLPTIALHPTSHLLLHESMAHERLHGLRTIRLGGAAESWTLADVEALAEPVAAVAVEVPLRELGGILPPWADLAGLAEVAHDREAAVHLDGARLWEAAAGYGRSPADVAACADSTYVSFYKGLGAVAGAALVGDVDLVEQARVWRHRHGGQVIALWPYAASALAALRLRLPRMPAYLELAREVAAGLAGVEGVEVVPAAPHTAMAHLHLEVDDAALRRAALAMAEEEGIATFTASAATPRPRWRLVELPVGDATVAMGGEAVVDAVARLVSSARRRPGTAGAG